MGSFSLLPCRGQGLLREKWKLSFVTMLLAGISGLVSMVNSNPWNRNVTVDLHC